jgi:membrane-associated phospholipid phosphatase
VARRASTALLAAAACALLAVVVWALTFHSALGLAADRAALDGFMQLSWTPVAGPADWLARLCNPLPFAVLAGSVVLLAHFTRGPRGTLATGTVLLAANVTTQYLKPALATPRAHDLGYVTAASWPSGHSTAAMALALCAVIAAPPAFERLTAVLGGLFAVAVAYAVVLLGWHYPSDALGGFAVAGATTSLAVAALRWAEARWPAGSGRRAAARALQWPPAAPVATLAGTLAVLVLAAGVLRTATELPTPEQQLAFLAFAGGIVALALALAVACSRALRPG